MNLSERRDRTMGRHHPLLRFLIATLLVFVASLALAQPEPKVQWSATLDRPEVRAGEWVQVRLTGKIQKDWHIYSSKLKGEWISLRATVDAGQPVNLAPGADFDTPLDLIEPEGIKKYDRGFKADVVTFEGEIVVALPVQIKPGTTGDQTLNLTVRSQACDARSCDPPRRDPIAVPFTVAPGEPRVEFASPNTSVPPQTAGFVTPRDDTQKPAATGTTQAPVDDTTKAINQARGQGLLSFMALSFGAGLLALLTPCVWPMIPITVSYFTKGQGAKVTEGGKKASNLPAALAYCLGIIGTFVALGLVVTLVFGASGVQSLAASPIVNAALALLFILLAMNLFGVFELSLPQAWVGALQNKTGKVGWLGPVLMGFVFSLTTFTCTVPFVGTLLVSATTGDLLFPIFGMASFAMAFALPFFVLAMLPQFMSKLPKAGGWLVSVKIYMGFLELAAAVKFISNVDLSLQLGWLTREVFLAMWVAILAAATCYLFGWFRLPHEDDVKVGWGRRIFAVVNVGLVVFLLAAIPGNARLGNLAGFLPPNPYPGKAGGAGTIAWQHKVDAAVEKARAENKLIFVNFTGVTCTNCRVMEGEVFPVPEIRQRIEAMVPLELYTDRETAEDRANAKLREELTKSSTNPVYVVMTPDKRVIDVFQGMSLSNQEFITWLDRAKARAADLN